MATGQQLDNEIAVRMINSEIEQLRKITAGLGMTRCGIGGCGPLKELVNTKNASSAVEKTPLAKLTDGDEPQVQSS